MNTVKACPECDSANISYLPRTKGSSYSYYCQENGHRFNTAVERERKTKGHAGIYGLAKVLLDMDPDDIP